VGWPKSATFRTIDLVGLDILGHVVGNMTSNVHDERSDLRLPDFFTQMLQRKWLGDKTKGGFYKKAKGGEGKDDERMALDWKTLEYHPRQKPKFAALDMAKNIEDTARACGHSSALKAARRKATRRERFLWSALTDLWTYAANRVPEISNSIVEIDRAMRLGFNWEMGPFELWDAAGVEATVARMKKEGKPVAANVERLLAAGRKTWYTDDPTSTSGRKYWELGTEDWEAVKVPAGVWSVTVAKKSNGVVKKNSGASLVDLGDGVGCIEFHSKMNSLGADIISLILQTLKPGGPGDAFDAFVITNDATNFSVGANLMLLLMSVQEEEWDDVDLAIRQFQGMTQAIKFSPKPVVASAFGCAWAGTEISLHAAARQPHAELYTGLVEVGVGLLPGGGGCKRDAAAGRRRCRSSACGKGSGEAFAGSIELLEAMKRAFETIATAKVATSAHEARAFGFLTDSDRISMNRERVLSDAKARVLELVRAGYEPLFRAPTSRPRRKPSGHAPDGRSHDAAGRLHHRIRSKTGDQDR